MNQENKYNVYLFKFDVTNRDFYFFTSDELPPNGFSSLYAITAETAEAISAGGAEAEFKGYKGVCHSKSLALDIDTETGAMETESALRRLGLAFEVWTTGNRGRHFYIPRPHAPSHLLPQIDKEWVKSNIPAADLSIYSHLHMFRVPGTRHSKTGKLKMRLYSVEGNPLILPNTVEERQVLITPQVRAQSSIFVDDKVMTMTIPHEEGMRHDRLLALGLALRERHEPIEFIERWLQHTNLLFEEQIPEEEFSKIVDFVASAQL